MLTSKETFFLVIDQEGKKGIGECNLFRGLSADDVPDYEAKLQWVEQHLHLGEEGIAQRNSLSFSFYINLVWNKPLGRQQRHSGTNFFLLILQQEKTQFLSTDLFGWALPTL